MRDYLRLLRPADWVKNTFVFAALAFGAKLHDPHAIQLSLAAFVVFCLASSAGYILNDILDRERDQAHPIKRNRPIASGAVCVRDAVIVAAVLLAGASGICVSLLPTGFAAIAGSYLALTMLYSVALKFRMLLDVITIAMLFVLRALGGAFAVDVAPSPWLVVCTFMLCLFLGFGKRRCEVAMLGDSDTLLAHRPTLIRYTPDLLNQLLSTTGGIAIITFLLYTLDTTPTPFVNKHQLVYTLPLVVYGVFRYAMLIELGKATGPTDLILKDPPFLVTVLLWTGLTLFILYHGMFPMGG
jgi:4-hydroxybenzoate polyprenyltransferase